MTDLTGLFHSTDQGEVGGHQPALGKEDTVLNRGAYHIREKGEENLLCPNTRNSGNQNPLFKAQYPIYQ